MADAFAVKTSSVNQDRLPANTMPEIEALPLETLVLQARCSALRPCSPRESRDVASDVGVLMSKCY